MFLLWTEQIGSKQWNGWFTVASQRTNSRSYFTRKGFKISHSIQYHSFLFCFHTQFAIFLTINMILWAIKDRTIFLIYLKISTTSFTFPISVTCWLWTSRTTWNKQYTWIFYAKWEIDVDSTYFTRVWINIIWPRFQRLFFLIRMFSISLICFWIPKINQYKNLSWIHRKMCFINWPNFPIGVFARNFFWNSSIRGLIGRFWSESDGGGGGSVEFTLSFEWNRILPNERKKFHHIFNWKFHNLLTLTQSERR